MGAEPGRRSGEEREAGTRVRASPPPVAPPPSWQIRPAARPIRSASSPSREAIVRLVGAVLAKQTDERAQDRRYLGLDVLARCRHSVATDTGPEVTTNPAPILTT